MRQHMPDQEQTTEVEVAIIGAGIVGLTAALALTRVGVDVVVVERHAGTHDHPRSRGVNARTMEIYRELGVADELRVAAAPLARSYGLYRGTSLAEAIGANPRRAAGEAPLSIRTTDPAVTAAFGPEPGCRVTLDLAEPIVLAAARRQGARVWFATAVTALDQHADGVDLHLSPAADTIRAITDGAVTDNPSVVPDAEVVAAASGERVPGLVRARYVIDAEGAGGRFRARLGIAATTGASYGHYLNVLFEADLAEFVRDREFSMLKINRPEVSGTIAAIDNQYRWVMHIAYDPTREALADYPPQRCAELVSAAIGPTGADGRLPEVKIVSVLAWEATESMVERFSKGRVFLVGDVAHQMPPTGGRGANTGIAEAHNLAWKLQAALTTDAKNDDATAAADALLATYDDERRPAARQAVAASGANAQVIDSATTADWDSRWLALDAHGSGNAYHSRLTVPREGRPGLGDVVASHDGSPGTRIPHRWVTPTVSTLDLVAGRWTLLSRQPDWHGVSVPVVDPGPELADAAGIGEGGALLVRPDGYVAWRSSGSELDQAHNLVDALTTLGSVVPDLSHNAAVASHR